MTISIDHLKDALEELREHADHSKIREAVGVVLRQLPKTAEYLRHHEIALDLIGRIDDPEDKTSALVDFIKGVPDTGVFLPLYKKAVEEAIASADAVTENTKRITNLIKLGSDIPKTKETLLLRVMAWRLAMGLPDKPRFIQPDLKKIGSQLPKANDYLFYRGYTLMGVAAQIPKEGLFFDAYREALELAIKAAATIDEPYYRKYALMFVAGEVKSAPELFPVYKQAVEGAHRAAQAMKDSFARQHALLDILQEAPKIEAFFPLIQDVLEESLGFFSMKSWMEDVEFLDVVDMVLSAEETVLSEAKQRRFLREKYADLFSLELEKLGRNISDTRFIETLKPFAHVWVQPKRLRESVRKVVDRLESLKSSYHGGEIERPVFLKHLSPVKSEHLARVDAAKGAKAPEECLVIDLGATNTVVMRRKTGLRPEFLMLGGLTRRYESIYCVPTVLGLETSTIGAEVTEDKPVVNIKQMLLDGSGKGREYMEMYLQILFAHLKKSVAHAGWFNTVFSKSLADVLYLTVPVGFADYKNTLREITSRAFKGVKTEFIEEPLAAAIGYEVAEAQDKVFMVVDFGGSTLNMMVVRLNLGEIHVVAKPERALFLGGSDIDLWLAEYLAAQIGLPAGEVPPYRLIVKAEAVKIALSSQSECTFEWNGAEVCKVSRQTLEEILDKHDFYKNIDRNIAYVLKQAEKVGLRKDRIEAVLLTGGSSQIPSFKDKIGHIFHNLRVQNLIYDHSPLSAVASGAALYGSKEVVDRHLGMAYAVRYATTDKEKLFSYSILLEKGDALPLEKTFRLNPARKLGPQSEMRIEFFEAPDGLLSRRWVREEGMEFLKQELIEAKEDALKAMKSIIVKFKEPLSDSVNLTFKIDEKGFLTVILPGGEKLETGLRLQ
ncbi:MAG: Hsp70 family protein [Deltaproteobacteria bacterium]|nr:Hsp70 family protein [Deltaproteobacteria bacterium]